MRYRFYIRKNEEQENEVCPGWTDSQSLRSTRDGERRIVKTEISQPFRFTKGNGYEIIQGADIEDEFTFRIAKIEVSGAESEWHNGTFTKTDCEIDEDQGWALAKIETRGAIVDYLADEDTEFDLIELGAQKSTINYYAYPLLQVYAIGTNSVTNFQLGAYSERQVEPIFSVHGALVDDLGFGHPQRFGYAVFDSDIPFPIGGVYAGSNGTAEIDDYFSYENAEGVLIVGPFDQITVYRVFYEGGVIGEGVLSESGDYIDVTLDVASGQTWSYRFYFMNVAARVLTREGLLYNGQLGTEIIEFDQFAIGTNYTHSQPVQIELFPSIEVAQSNRGFGLFPGQLFGFSGQFIAIPSSIPGEIVAPIGRANWADISWWVRIGSEVRGKIVAGRQKITLADAYAMEECVSKLLSAGRSGLSFLPDSLHSQLFFSSTNPVTSHSFFRYFVVPKSNVLTLNYDTPAGKAPAKLTDFVELWRAFFQAEVAIEEGRLIVETQHFFNNGGSYIGEQGRIVDLTAERLRNGKTWADGANRYTYEKESLPERILFRYMDDASTIFQGQDIVVLSRYVERGNKEERRSGRFSTDLPLALSNPRAFSEDGFFLLACQPDNNGDLFVAETVVVGFGQIQNGALSFPFLHDNYYRDNLPAKRVELNGEEIVARSTKPTKRQNIRCGEVEGSISVGDIVKTGLGEGRCDSVEKNMETGALTISVTHKTT